MPSQPTELVGLGKRDRNGLVELMEVLSDWVSMSHLLCGG